MKIMSPCGRNTWTIFDRGYTRPFLIGGIFCSQSVHMSVVEMCNFPVCAAAKEMVKQ